MIDEEIIDYGTQFKVIATIDEVDGYKLEDLDFDVEVFVSPHRRILISKSEAISVVGTNVKVWVDSAQLGEGRVECNVILRIPDGDSPNQIRQVVKGFRTPYKIRKL